MTPQEKKQAETVMPVAVIPGMRNDRSTQVLTEELLLQVMADDDRISASVMML